MARKKGELAGHFGLLAFVWSTFRKGPEVRSAECLHVVFAVADVTGVSSYDEFRADLTGSDDDSFGSDKLADVMGLDFADCLERGFGVGTEDNSDIKILMYFVWYFLVLRSEGSWSGLEVFQTLLFEEAGELGFDFLSQ